MPWCPIRRGVKGSAGSRRSGHAARGPACSCVACRYGRGARRPARTRCHTTDMTDAERQAIEPVMPWPAWVTGNGGRPEKYCRRLIVDAIRYVVDNGCKWRNLPALAHRPRDLHSLVTGRRSLRTPQRPAGTRPTGQGRQAEPSAGIIDSQTLRAAETVATDSRGYDAAKKVQGRKRHVIVDTLGPAARRHRHRRQRPGPRRRQARMGTPARLVREDRADLGRQCLRGPARHLGQRVPPAHPPDRHTQRRCQRLRRPAPQVGGRESH
jgi:transposase